MISERSPGSVEESLSLMRKKRVHPLVECAPLGASRFEQVQVDIVPEQEQELEPVDLVVYQHLHLSVRMKAHFVVLLEPVVVRVRKSEVQAMGTHYTEERQY